MSYSGKFKDKNNNLHPVTSVLYGTCDTAAATAAKVVTCTDFDTLMTGVTIRVKFANANTAASPTVNINSTGAKSVYRFGSTAPVDGNSWNAGEVVELVYDGTSFFMTGADDIAAKQDATDNSLDTEDKTIVGAINEHEGDIGSLKSGLTTLDDEVNGDATTYPYADVITIEDAVPSNLADCSVKIEPVQDLHGYDKPWVGGAGKNKLPMTVDGIKAVNTSGTWSGNAYTLNGCTFTVQTDNDGNVIGILVNGTAVRDTEFYVFSDTSNSCPFNGMLINGCINGSNATYDLRVSDITTSSTQQTTGDGEIINVAATGQWRCTIMIRSGYATSNLTFYPMIRLSTETDATFAPYTNVCPITGHTEASVQRDGKNWFDYTKATANYRVNIDNGNLEVQSGFYASDYIEVFAQQTFTLNYVYSSLAQYGMAFYDANKTFVSGRKQKQTEGDTTFTYTVPNGCKYVRFTVPTDITVSSVQMELSSSATDYEPYQGKTYTIALGDTIYGGTVDFDSGVMTVDRALVALDSLNWEIRDDHVIRSAISQAAEFVAQNVKVDAICSCYYVSDQYHSAEYKPCIAFNTATQIYLYDDAHTFTSTADAQQYLDGQTICYKLATPFTIQLTPQQIQLLKGQNTLTASTGQISVTVNGVSGAIGSVQEQVNEIAEDVVDVQSSLINKAGYNLTAIAANATSFTFADLATSYIGIMCLSLPSGANTAKCGLYVLVRQGTSVSVTNIYESASLGVTATISDGDVVIEWTTNNPFGGAISILQMR